MSPNQDSSKNPHNEIQTEFNMRMFVIGASMFMIAQFIGLLTGFLNLSLPEYAITAGVSSSVGSFVIAFLIATTILIVLLKVFKRAMMFKIMLALLIFLGSEMVLSTLLIKLFATAPILLLGISLVEIIAISTALILAVIRFVYPTVFVQNFTMTLAIAGIGASLGLILPLGAVVLILILLSVYDYVAVYKTKHMVKMFKNLLSRNVPLSLVIPGKLKHFNTKVDDAMPGSDSKGERKFMMLGTGDIAFPIILAVSAARHSLFAGVSVLFGAFFGITLVYSFLLRSKGGAIPALPPIALCTLLTLIISLSVEWLAVVL